MAKFKARRPRKNKPRHEPKLEPQLTSIEKHDLMIANRESVAEAERLKHMTPGQKTRYERHQERASESAIRKDTAEYRQNVKQAIRDHDARMNRRSDVLGRRQDRLDYRARRDDVMGRRQERADYRARRDDVMGRRNDRLNARGERIERNIFIDDVHGRLIGSSASRESIEEVYKEASSKPKWGDMNRNERISAVMDGSIDKVARNAVMSRMSEKELKKLSGNATLHNVIDERAVAESGVIRNRIEQARKNRSSGSPGSAQQEALDNPVNNPSAAAANDATGNFDFNSINMDGATNGGIHAFNRRSKDVRFAEANMNKALTNEDVASAIKNRLNVTDDELADMVGDAGKRNDIFRDRLESAKSNPTLMDNMWGNKVPQIAGGALLTAGVVSSLSSSKGQQSNASLYGQQQPYY